MCDSYGCGHHNHQHTHLVLPVSGMSCPHCEQSLEQALSGLTGIEHVKANHREGMVELGLNHHGDLGQIKKAIIDLGFEA